MIGQTSLFSEPQIKLRDRVTVELVTLTQARHSLENFHYLHRTRTGRQLNYAVYIDGIVDGVVTYAYPMMTASLEDVPSDELLEFARLYLHSNIPHTATCAIGKTLRRVQKDWLTYFPSAKPVLMVVSWSDCEYHKGTIYKAANFRFLHRSKPGGKQGLRKQDRGRPRRLPKDYSDYKHEKDCWIYRFSPATRKVSAAQVMG